MTREELFNGYKEDVRDFAKECVHFEGELDATFFDNWAEHFTNLAERLRPSLLTDLEEAAWQYAQNEFPDEPRDNEYSRRIAIDAFIAGTEWMAGRDWIDDGSMPPETKQESDTLQGHREWTESEPVLAWDSMYGCRVDWTRNGKWMSEQKGGYTGQVCHGIIAWRPIPEYKEKQ